MPVPSGLQFFNDVLQWVTGNLLPSNSIRDPLTVSISSKTRTLTLWWTTALRAGRDLKR